MCKIMEDFAKEERTLQKIVTAAKLPMQKRMSEAEIIDFFHFTDEQMNFIRKLVSELTSDCTLSSITCFHC